MKRLYFLTDTLANASKVVDDLHREGLSDWHIHVISRDEAGLYHRQIHGAHIFHKSDLIHSGEQGAIIGALLGLLIALAIDNWLTTHNLPLSIMILIAGVFTLFGAWSGGLVGVMRENYKITRFHDALDNGDCLLLVDIHKGEEQRIKQQIAQYHPNATLAAEGTSLIQPFNTHFWFPPKKI